MKIDVRFRAIEPSDALRSYVARRVHLQLSRFNGTISSVVIRIGDINGPKGGADKRCQLTVRAPSLRSVAIDGLSADVYSAVDITLERAARAVGRELERMRAARRPDGDLRTVDDSEAHLPSGAGRIDWRHPRALRA